MNNIEIFQTNDGLTNIDVKLENETVWLSLSQIVELFQRDRTVINRHINNIFKQSELDKKEVCADYAHTTKHGAIEGKTQTKKLTYYNLDMIISVGYRVNSKRGIQFRKWATQILKDHLIKGFSVNQKRLEELKQSVKLINTVIDNYSVSNDETKALIKIVSDYTYALDLLDDYDYQRVSINNTSQGEVYRITYEEVRKVIENLKIKFDASELFGSEKDKSIHSCINTIYQSFGDMELYPSIEEKAAALLYFLTKNHPFIDGNKRIAAFLFIWFLDKNNILYNVDGNKRIAENTLVALTLMIAESKPDEKDTINKITVNLINKNN